MPEPTGQPGNTDNSRAAWLHAHKDDPDFLDNSGVIPPPTGVGNSQSRKAEKEWADYYQANKDDPDLRGEPMPAPTKSRGRPSRNMGARISVRFTPEEMEGIRSRSQEEGLYYPELVHRAVNAYCKKEP